MKFPDISELFTYIQRSQKMAQSTGEVLKEIAGIMQLKIEQEMKIGRLLGQLLETYNIALANLTKKIEEVERQMAEKKKEPKVADNEGGFTTDTSEETEKK
jgi:hypothetical protein